MSHEFEEEAVVVPAEAPSLPPVVAARAITPRGPSPELVHDQMEKGWRFACIGAILALFTIPFILIGSSAQWVADVVIPIVGLLRYGAWGLIALGCGKISYAQGGTGVGYFIVAAFFPPLGLFLAWRDIKGAR